MLLLRLRPRIRLFCPGLILVYDPRWFFEPTRCKPMFTERAYRPPFAWQPSVVKPWLEEAWPSFSVGFR